MGKSIINVNCTQYSSLQILSAFGHSPTPSNNCLLVFNCSFVTSKELQLDFSCRNVCSGIVQVTSLLSKSEQ